jgi:hypothetical protein
MSHCHCMERVGGRGCRHVAVAWEESEEPLGVCRGGGPGDKSTSVDIEGAHIVSKGHAWVEGTHVGVEHMRVSVMEEDIGKGHESKLGIGHWHR